MKNIKGCHYRELEHKGGEPLKHAYPYYKMDDFHPALSKELEQRFTRLYFAGADRETIMNDTGMTERQYYYYKKKLFGYLFSQDNVGFILFSSVDIANTQVVRRLRADPDNAYICTRECEVMKSCLKGMRIMNLPTQQENSPKLVRAEDLRTQLFDYKKLVKICSIHHKHIFKPSNIMVINIDV